MEIFSLLTAAKATSIGTVVVAIDNTEDDLIIRGTVLPVNALPEVINKATASKYIILFVYLKNVNNQ